MVKEQEANLLDLQTQLADVFASIFKVFSLPSSISEVTNENIVSSESSLALNRLVSNKDKALMSSLPPRITCLHKGSPKREVLPKIIRWLESRSK